MDGWMDGKHTTQIDAYMRGGRERTCGHLHCRSLTDKEMHSHTHCTHSVLLLPWHGEGEGSRDMACQHVVTTTTQARFPKVAFCRPCRNVCWRRSLGFYAPTFCVRVSFLPSFFPKHSMYRVVKQTQET